MKNNKCIYPNCTCRNRCIKANIDFESPLWDEIQRQEWESYQADYYAQLREEEEYYSQFDDNREMFF